MDTMLLFAATFEVEFSYIVLILGGAAGTIAFLFKLLISSKDATFALLLAQKDAEKADLVSMKKSYQEIALEAQKSALEMANFMRAKSGLPPVIPAVPVVSESHSPSTERQRETAFIQTMRATMALIKLETGQAPRPEPERAGEIPKSPDSVKEIREVRDVQAIKADVKEIKKDVKEVKAEIKDKPHG